MEPRPPQPRSSHPFEPPASPETAGIGERLYPTPGEPAYYPGAEAYPPGAAAEPPLLPRRQRRQRGALRGIAVAVLTIGALLAVGWYFRDGVRGFVDPPGPTPTVAAQVAAPGTPAPAAESAALPNALATVTPTQVSEVSATATPGSDDESNVAQESGAGSEDTSAEPDRDISSETLPLLDLLPTQAEMPPGLVLADEAERSQAEVVASLGGTEEASQLLDEWGWSGNAFRDFIADAEAPPPTGTTFLNASVHRFADAQAANNAMVVFSTSWPIVSTLVIFAVVAYGFRGSISTGNFLAFNTAFTQFLTGILMLAIAVSPILQCVSLYERARPIHDETLERVLAEAAEQPELAPVVAALHGVALPVATG